MRKFITKIVVLAAMIAVADVIFGYVMKYCLAHAKGGEFKSMNLLCEKETDILLFGTSRCNRHYDPQIISDSLDMSCYNLGRNAMGIICNYALFTIILEKYTPKVVVYDVHPTFDLKVEDNYDRYTKEFRIFYGYGETERILSSDIDYSEHLKNQSAFYRYNYKFIGIIWNYIHSSSEVDGNGFHTENKQMEIEVPIQQDTKLADIDSLKLKYFENIISTCQNKGVELVFTVSPCYKKTSSIAFDPIKKLCDTNNIPFIDYYTDATFTQNKNFFFDSEHMNQDGAEAFSKRFAHDLKELLPSMN